MKITKKNCACVVCSTQITFHYVTRPRNFSAGDVEFRLLSFLTLYTALIQGIMLTGGALIWRHRIDYLMREGPDFAQAMIEATFLGAFTPLFLSPFVQLPESGKTAKYVSSWADYQVKKYYATFQVFTSASTKTAPLKWAPIPCLERGRNYVLLTSTLQERH